MALPEPCLVKLQTFEGPLELLLHLIKKNEVNIYDIPIAIIMEQYLEYIGLMKKLDLEVVGDYLVIAAELGLIKSKMLLPKAEIDKEGEEDPRIELVRRLLEYQQYKDAAEQLLKSDVLERDVFIRMRHQNEEEEGQKNQVMKTDLWSLIDAFREIHRRRDYSLESLIKFDLETFTLDDKTEELTTKLRECRTIPFAELFSENPSRFDLVITFLALLELIKNRVLGAFQDLPYAPIRIVYLGENQEWNIVT